MKNILPLLLLFSVSVGHAATVHGNHVTVSCTESWITGGYLSGGVFFLGTSGDRQTRMTDMVSVSIAPDTGWEIDQGRTKTQVSYASEGSYAVSHVEKLEKPKGGPIRLFCANVQIGSVQENSETTTGAFVGFHNLLNPDDAPDNECLVPVSFMFTQRLGLENTKVEISCTGGTLYQKTNGKLVNVDSSMSVSDLLNGTFYLRGTSFSNSIADKTISIKHVLTGATDTAKFTCFGGLFVVNSQNSEFGGNTLTDFRVAIMTITPKPADLANEIQFEFEDVIPDEDVANLVNQENKFQFPCEEHPNNPLLWRTSDKLLWYAHQSPRCCYKYKGHMLFRLKGSFGGAVSLSSRTYDISLPAERNSAGATFTLQWRIGEPEDVEGGARCRVKIDLDGFSFFGRPLVFSETQFYSQTVQEETIHIEQMDPSSQKCLIRDLFTVEGVKHQLNMICQGRYDGEYYYARSDERPFIKRQAEMAIEQAESNEKVASKSHFEQYRQGVLEYEAKAEAGYTAGYMYHCTYLEKFGENPYATDRPRIIQ